MRVNRKLKKPSINWLNKKWLQIIWGSYRTISCLIWNMKQCGFWDKFRTFVANQIASFQTLKQFYRKLSKISWTNYQNKIAITIATASSSSEIFLFCKRAIGIWFLNDKAWLNCWNFLQIKMKAIKTVYGVYLL